MTKFQQDSLVSLSLAAFGGLILFWTLSAPILDEKYSKEGKTIAGKVRGTNSASSGTAGGPKGTFLDYEFELPNGQTVTGSTYGYSKKKGENVQVEYLTSDPTENRVLGSHSVKPGIRKYMEAFGWVCIALSLFSFSSVVFKERKKRSG